MSSQTSILKDFYDESRENVLHNSSLIQEKCAKVGFDWPDASPVFDKVTEELAEIKEAIANPNKSAQHVQDELGDLLFACVNLCRHLKVVPEEALAQANQKFINRFQLVEIMLKDADKAFEDTNLQELEAYWQQVKQAMPEI